MSGVCHVTSNHPIRAHLEEVSCDDREAGGVVLHTGQSLVTTQHRAEDVEEELERRLVEEVDLEVHR